MNESPPAARPAEAPAYRAYQRGVLRLGVFAVAAASALKFSAGAHALPLDDAYIHLTFARNLAAGLGFCFNPGEPSLGFTSPLWVMLLGLAARLGSDPVHASRLLSIVLFAGSAVLVFELARSSVQGIMESCRWPAHPHEGRVLRSILPSALGLLAGLGMSASGNMLWLSGTGMEAMLFLFLGLCSILLWTPGASPGGPPIRETGRLKSSMRPVAGGAALGLLVLTRPEGMALAVVPGLVALGPGTRSKSVIAGLGLAVLICAPWFFFSYASTGFIIPPTRTGKLASDLFNAGVSVKGIYKFTLYHLEYLWSCDRGLAVLLLLCAGGAVAAWAWSWRKDAPGGGRMLLKAWTPAGLVALWAALHFGMHCLLFRSTMIITPYHNLRYQVMLIPALLAGGAYLAALLGARMSGLLPPAARTPALLAAALFLAAPLAAELRNCSYWQRLYHANSEQIEREHLAAARWADQELPADARLAALDIGTLGYRSGRYVIDLGGLVDPEAHEHLAAHRTGPYMAEKRATHYFALKRHDSERITGVFRDNGVLYLLRPVKSFHYFPPLPYPVFLHSFTIEVYAVGPPPGK